MGIEIYASSEYESLFGKGKGSLVNPLRAGTKGFWKFWIFDASREVEGATCPVPMETGARSFSKANARRGERLPHMAATKIKSSLQNLRSLRMMLAGIMRP